MHTPVVTEGEFLSDLRVLIRVYCVAGPVLQSPPSSQTFLGCLGSVFLPSTDSVGIFCYLSLLCFK